MSRKEAGDRLRALGRGPAVLKPRDVALACLHAYRQYFKIQDPFAEFVVTHEFTDELGLTHVRLRQVHRGLPVWGKELYVHLDRGGAVYLVEGRTVPTPEIPVSPALTPDAAREAAVAAAGRELVSEVSDPELVVYAERGAERRLVYHLELYRGWERWQYFVDARTGEVVERYRDVWEDAVPASGQDLFGVRRAFSAWREGGSYYLIDTSLPMHARDPSVAAGNIGEGNLVVLDAMHQDPERLKRARFVGSSAADRGWDPAAVTLVHALRTTYDYYYRTFGRNSIDGKGMNVIGLVHVGQNWENACWTGKYMFFGDGGSTFDSLAKALDVVAHEMQHGVTQYTARLEYKFQSGALNEAFSDIFACMVDREDWLMGEDVVRVPPGCLRNLINPHQGLAPLPAHMSEYRSLPLEEDNGGVHINCTIPARAAYLMAEGLSREGLGAAIGREKTEKIFWRALTTHLTAQSDFLACRRATLQAAEELFGAGAAEVQAVRAAWDAVGVVEAGGGGAPGGGGEAPPVPGGDNLLFIFYDEWDTPYLGFRTPDGREYYVSEWPVSETRPVVVGDGKLVLFVDAFGDLRVASLDPRDTYEERLTEGGIARTIAGSADGRYFAFTTGEFDDKIYVIDLTAPEEEAVREYRVYLPSDAPVRPAVEYADVIDFDLTGRRIVFDVLCRLDLPRGSYEYWSMGMLDLASGQIYTVLPPQPQGVHVGNPAPGNTRGWLLAADVYEEGQNRWRTILVDLRTGKTGLVAEAAAPQAPFGRPSLNGDDTAVAVQYNHDIVRVPVVERDGVLAGNFEARRTLVRTAYYPRFYRVGARQVKPVLQVSSASVDFGSVTVGQRKEAKITVTNAGNYHLTLQGFVLSDEQNFAHSGVHTVLAPGVGVEVAVVFAPRAAGAKGATLTVLSDDPERPRVEVFLAGEGIAGDTTPPAVAGTDPANGATNVPVSAAIAVTFTEDVQAGPAYDGIWLRDAAAGAVAVTKSISGRVLTLKPSANLAPGTTYTVFIPAGAVQDLAGNPLAQDYTFSFTTAAARKKGDANGDGQVNVLDVVRTVNIALGRVQPTDEERYAADANGDGVINVLDVVRIVNMALGRV
jgi:Zn-dependent metalloprotease